MLGPHSPAELLTVGPRFHGAPQGAETVGRVAIHRSKPPDPPGRSDSKKSDRPSAEILGTFSQAGLLIVDPRFTGSPQGSEMVARVVTQRSISPSPPGRTELK